MGKVVKGWKKVVKRGNSGEKRRKEVKSGKSGERLEKSGEKWE